MGEGCGKRFCIFGAPSPPGFRGFKGKVDGPMGPKVMACWRRRVVFAGAQGAMALRPKG